MSECREQNMLELLEIYMDLAEKQDEIIQQLSRIVRKQATEIQHMRNIEENICFERDIGLEMADDVVNQYNMMNGK